MINAVVDEGTEPGVPLISAVLLAAGQSRRLGQPKQLMPLGKTTVLEAAASNLLLSRVTEVIVVVGHRAEDMVRRLAHQPVRVVVNPAYRQGMGTSIAAGARLISDSTRGIMLALAEQPLIDCETLNQLIEAFGAGGKGIVIPTYRGQRGHPVIFARRYQEELLGLSGDTGGRQITNRHPDDVLEVPVGCPGIITDIDTIDNYLELSRLGEGCSPVAVANSRADRPGGGDG